jgi:hypothetical protein
MKLHSTWPYQQAANCSGESFFCVVRELHVNRDDPLVECQPLLYSFPATIVPLNVSVLQSIFAYFDHLIHEGYELPRCRVCFIDDRNIALKIMLLS